MAGRYRSDRDAREQAERAKVRREITPEEREGLRRYAQNYYEYKETYLAEAGK